MADYRVCKLHCNDIVDEDKGDAASVIVNFVSELPQEASALTASLAQ